MIKSVTSVLVLILICCGLCTCGGRPVYGPDDYLSNGNEYVDTYLLYVEEVIVPEVIYENEEAPIYLRVSAEANPGVLRGLSEDRWIGYAYKLYREPDEMWRVDACITGEGDPQQEPDDILPVRLTYMPPGDWVCIVWAAADRSLGGKHYKYNRGDTVGPAIPKEDLQEIRFTVNVVPRPEE